MKSRQPSERLLRELCAEIDPSDGISPRKTIHKKEQSEKDHRAQSLCAQIKRAIQLSLSDSNHDAVRELYVREVTPQRNLSHLCVTLEPMGFSTNVPPNELSRLIDTESGRIRCDVAEAIHRKRVPTLSYQIVPPQADEEVTNG